MLYLGVLVLLGLLILVHELGHLLAAKWTGIPVAEFAVGFGPKVWARRWRGTVYSLRAFPLGGFVLPAVQDEDFRSIPLRKRLVFFLGGPLANLAAAVPLLTLFNVARHGLSFDAVVLLPFRQVAGACLLFLSALPGLLSHPKELSGVVGIVAQGAPVIRSGRGLEMAISLSVSLAMLNLLPIPVLDGGQILLGTLEEVFPRFIKLRAPLTVLGMLALLGVMIYANVHDVIRIWG